MTFEGYASDLGFPVCSGGRYDNLLKQFGRSAPATGFALKTTRILELIASHSLQEPERTLILYEPSYRHEAFARAKELRVAADAMIETKLMTSPDSSIGQIYSLDKGVYEYQGKRYKAVIQYIKKK